ncbi:MAG: RNA polymerase sigma factor [Chitinivibrionales bacterium]|nr:RNA polymerase sigma factor [Chitinivibrionales bacterium]
MQHNEFEGMKYLKDLYLEYGPIIHNQFMKYGMWEQYKEDAVQEIFLKLLEMRKPIRFKDKRHEYAWLYVAVNNLCKNWYKRDKKVISKSAIIELVTPENCDRQLPFIFSDLLNTIKIKRIKQVGVLKFRECYNDDEIAETLKCSRATVRRDLAKFKESAAKFIKRFLVQGD